MAALGSATRGQCFRDCSNVPLQCTAAGVTGGKSGSRAAITSSASDLHCSSAGSLVSLI